MSLPSTHGHRALRPRGLSLIEILVVIALLGMILVAIIVSLTPGDDQRVRKEAERLAAYLTAASAEGLMRDGPVRVAFDLEDQRYAREVGRVGADISAAMWDPDKRAKRQTVGKPVKLTVLDLPLVGEMKSGRGWMVWNGVRTGGGVAVLEYNAAMWSVVVDPRSGDIDVVKGRGRLPERSVARGSRYFLNDNALAGLSGPGSDVLDTPNIDDLDAGVLPPLPNLGNDTPIEDDDDFDADLPLDDEEEEEEELQGPQDTPVEEDDDPEDLDAGVDDTPDADLGCTRDEDCKDPGDPSTEFHRCYLPPGEAGGTCVFDPAGMDFRVDRLTVTQPQGLLATLMSAVLQDGINRRRTNILFSFPYRDAPGQAWLYGPSDTISQGMYISQAETNGSSYQSKLDLPSFNMGLLNMRGVTSAQGNVSQVQYCDELNASRGGACTLEMQKRDSAFSGTAGRLEFYAQGGRIPGTRTECLIRFVLPSTTIVQFDLSYDRGWNADINMLAVINTSHADETELPENVIPAELKEALDDQNAEYYTLREIFKALGMADPTYDQNRDGVKDSWQMGFQGTASLVELGNNDAQATRILSGLVGREPSRTCSDDD
ncbi:MAG: Tfp pilus assembly protein FimT/FimU [Bradymonadia bacterium]